MLLLLMLFSSLYACSCDRVWGYYSLALNSLRWWEAHSYLAVFRLISALWLKVSLGNVIFLFQYASKAYTFFSHFSYFLSQPFTNSDIYQWDAFAFNGNDDEPQNKIFSSSFFAEILGIGLVCLVRPQFFSISKASANFMLTSMHLLFLSLLSLYESALLSLLSICGFSNESSLCNWTCISSCKGFISLSAWCGDRLQVYGCCSIDQVSSHGDYRELLGYNLF